MATIHWEDLAPGSVRELGTTSVGKAEIQEFARRYATGGPVFRPPVWS